MSEDAPVLFLTAMPDNQWGGPDYLLGRNVGRWQDMRGWNMAVLLTMFGNTFSDPKVSVERDGSRARAIVEVDELDQGGCYHLLMILTHKSENHDDYPKRVEIASLEKYACQQP